MDMIGIMEKSQSRVKLSAKARYGLRAMVDLAKEQREIIDQQKKDQMYHI